MVKKIQLGDHDKNGEEKWITVTMTKMAKKIQLGNHEKNGEENSIRWQQPEKKKSSQVTMPERMKKIQCGDNTRNGEENSIRRQQQKWKNPVRWPCQKGRKYSDVTVSWRKRKFSYVTMPEVAKKIQRGNQYRKGEENPMKCTPEILKKIQSDHWLKVHKTSRLGKY